MKKLLAVLFVLMLTLTAIPAMAGSLCPGTAWMGGDSGGSVELHSGSGICADVATLSVTNDNTQSAGLLWGSSTFGSTGLTAGTIGSFDTAAIFSGSSQPDYMLDFHDYSNVFGEGVGGDKILLIENQSSGLSGGTSGTMSLDPNATLFAVYDSTTLAYLNGGQSN